MIKTETRMIPQEEQIYYCDSCGKRLGRKAELEQEWAQELHTKYISRNIYNEIWGEFDTCYYLCCKCFNALHKHLTEPSNNKKGLREIFT